MDEPASYFCLCDPGFTGKNCESGKWRNSLLLGLLFNTSIGTERQDLIRFWSENHIVSCVLEETPLSHDNTKFMAKFIASLNKH